MIKLLGISFIAESMHWDSFTTCFPVDQSSLEKSRRKLEGINKSEREFNSVYCIKALSGLHRRL